MRAERTWHGIALCCRYSVSVDSSVLGGDCDGYVHRYRELRDQQHEPGLFVLDLGTCRPRAPAYPPYHHPTSHRRDITY